MFSIKPVVDGYLIKETAKPLIFTICALTVLILSGFLFELTDFIIIKKISTLTVLQLLLYRIPFIIVQTFPLSVLCAILLALGRMVKDNEFVALRLGGLSLYRAMFPFLFIALLVAGATYYINEEVSPWATHRSQNILRHEILKETLPGVEEKIFFRGPGDRFYYVGTINQKTGTLEDILVYELKGRNELPRIITAHSGKFLDDIWYLEKGLAIDFDEEGYPSYQISFNSYELNVGTDVERYFGLQRTPQEMSRKELRGEIELFSRSGINVNTLLVDYHIKLAVPISAFIFVVIGVPLGINYGRGRGLSIIFSIVLSFSYYVFQAFSRSLGRNDVLSPLFAAWLPNLTFLAVGLIIILREEKFRF